MSKDADQKYLMDQELKKTVNEAKWYWLTDHNYKETIITHEKAWSSISGKFLRFLVSFW